MKADRNLLSFVRPAIRDLVAYHLDPYDVPLKLDQNENTAGVPKKVREIIDERLRQVALQRYPTPGQPEIKKALSELNDWPAEGVLVGNGSDELLSSLAMTVLEPGRRALYPGPSFFVYGHATRVVGARGIEIPLQSDLQYDVEALLRGIEEHGPHLVFICSPNNPTGSTLSEDAIRRIVSSAPGLVALDEAYWEFHGWNGRELLDDHPNLIVFRTFSKALAMAGLRVGYLLGQAELTEQMVKVQQPYPLNRLSCVAAMTAIEHQDTFLAAAKETALERDRLYERLAGLEGVTVYPSKANFLAFRTRLGGKKTFEGLLERGVLVRDVGKHPLMTEALRVGVGTPEENETFFNALADVLRSETNVE
jgi:histidinol-phosphate aminotransferase